MSIAIGAIHAAADRGPFEREPRPNRPGTSARLPELEKVPEQPFPVSPLPTFEAAASVHFCSERFHREKVVQVGAERGGSHRSPPGHGSAT